MKDEDYDYAGDMEIEMERRLDQHLTYLYEERD